MRIGSEVRDTGKSGMQIKSTINLKHASAAVRAKGADALKDTTEFLLQESNKTIPHDEGTMERTGTTDLDRAALEAVVTYDGPYVLKQHEDTRLRHPNGRRAMWLKLTLKEQAATIQAYIAKALREVFK